MPPTRCRYWCIRRIAGHARSEIRGEASEGQIAYSSDNQSYRGPATRAQRNERDPSRDLLSAAASHRRGRHYTARRGQCGCKLQWLCCHDGNAGNQRLFCTCFAHSLAVRPEPRRITGSSTTCKAWAHQRARGGTHTVSDSARGDRGGRQGSKVQEHGGWPALKRGL